MNEHSMRGGPDPRSLDEIARVIRENNEREIREWREKVGEEVRSKGNNPNSAILRCTLQDGDVIPSVCRGFFRPQCASECKKAEFIIQRK